MTEQELLLQIKRQHEKKGFNFTEVYEKHLREPSISPRIYMHSVRFSLAKRIKDRKKIYLDTNYWIKLRNCALGRSETNTYMKIYALIQKLTREKKIILPISTTLFAELSLQEDPITQTKMAEIMDQFSDGIAVDFEYDLISNELVYLFTKHSNQHLHIERDNFCWTHSGRIFGQATLTNENLSKDKERALQKTLIDKFSYITVSEIIELMRTSNDYDYKGSKELLANNLNKDPNALNQNKKDFRNIFLDEIGGIASISKPFLKEALTYIFEAVNGFEPTIEENADFKDQENMIYNLFKLNKITDELPAYQILAGLNANVRCGYSQIKFKPNDFDDFRHASSSLPYFNYFFTENPLAHMITNKPTDYASLYGTIVKSKPEHVLLALESIE